MLRRFLLARRQDRVERDEADHASVTLSNFNQGHILCTAAINSDGTIASGDHLNKTTTGAGTYLIATGEYQVAFLYPCGTPTANNGWMRIAQVDTLTTGTIVGASPDISKN